MRMFTPTALATASTASLLIAVAASAAPVARSDGPSAEHARIVAHWTPERRAAAIPRDLVIDERGYGYLRMPDGSLQPYGHSVAASRASSPLPMAKPGGDTTGPTIAILDPTAGETIGASHTFQASVTDASGVRSVSFKIAKAGSRTQSFIATRTTGDTWQVSLSGFTDGEWSWSVVAKDNANNTATVGPNAFTVDTSGGGGRRRWWRWRRDRHGRDERRIRRRRCYPECGRSHLLRDAGQRAAHRAGSGTSARARS